VYLGFTSSKTVTLSNTSDVPLNYRAYVPNDGNQTPICFDLLSVSESQCDELVSDEPDVDVISEEQPRRPETVDTKPKEFTVEPSSGVLQPKSEVQFTVTLCANSMSKYFRQLAVNFDEVANETFTIPITAQYANYVCFVHLLTNKVFNGC